MLMVFFCINTLYWINACGRETIFKGQVRTDNSLWRLNLPGHCYSQGEGSAKLAQKGLCCRDSPYCNSSLVPGGSSFGCLSSCGSYSASSLKGKSM